MPPDPTSTPRRTVLFEKKVVPIPGLTNPDQFAWPWMAEIFDAEFPKVPLWKRILLLLSSLIIIKQSRAEIAKNADILYGYLPNRLGELRRARAHARKYLQMALKGPWSKRLFLIGYIDTLRGLVLAIGTKLANSLTRPNRWGWKDLRAYRLFVALQTNLARILPQPIYFVTLTFEGKIHYNDVRSHLKDFREDTFDRLGYQSVAVIAFGTHTKYQEWRHKGYYYRTPVHKEPRLHCHLMIWPFTERGDKEEKESYQGLQKIIAEKRHGIGEEHDLEILPTTEDFLRVCSYMALNYCGSLLIDRKNGMCPIPPRSNPLTPPDYVYTGRKWARTSELAHVTPYMIAWRKAAGRYAESMGYSSGGSWLMREAEGIKEFMEPEQWREATVTGLDGYNYLVQPKELTNDGTEGYMLINPERPIYTISESELSHLGTLGAFPGALHARPDFHPLYGEAQFANPPTRGEVKRHQTSLLAKATIGAIGIALIGVVVWKLHQRKR